MSRVLENCAIAIKAMASIPFSHMVLLHELPDPHAELHVQQHLNDFQVFPELPIEIRLKIWRATFPKGRTLNFDKVPFPCRLPPPITHRVNRESRRETFAHYQIFRLVDSHDYRLWKAAYFITSVKCPKNGDGVSICISPSLDVIQVSLWLLTNRWLNGMWMKIFPAQSLSCFSTVQQLRFTGVWWNEVIAERVLIADLQHFKCLRKLEIVVETGASEREHCLLCMEHLRSVFEKLKVEDPSRTMPKISLLLE